MDLSLNDIVCVAHRLHHHDDIDTQWVGVNVRQLSA